MKQTTNFCGCAANPKDSLTPKDYSLIDAYRIHHLNNIEVESALFLSFWNEAKKPLYELFGEQLILSKPISYKKPKEEIKNELADLLAQHPFASAWTKWANSNFSYAEFWDNPNYQNETATAIAGSADNYKNYILNLLTPSRLANNKVGFAATYNLREGVCRSTTLKVQPNTSLIKTIRKLVSSYLPAEADSFEDFAKQHSLILNQKELAGTLHLSIHPLDFYTASDNSNGWKSCMNWRDGEYRQGTVEMCNSSYALVVYLDSAEPYSFAPGFTWNNKKWREFFLVDVVDQKLKLIAPIKGYPYQNKELEESAINWLLDLAKQNPNLISCTYDATTQTLFHNQEAIGKLSFETNYMYNDFYSSNHSLLFDSNAARTINYSGQAQCMCCGEPLCGFAADEEEARFLTCETCSPRIYCDCCDCLITGDPIESPVNGKPICEYCYDQIGECEFCGNLQYYDRIDYIVTKQNPRRRCICDTCQSERLEKPIWKYHYDFDSLSFRVDS